MIRVAPISEERSEPGLHVEGEALLLTIPDVARYRIEGGTEIVVDAHPSAPDRNIRLYLLGLAFGALLHQRGLLPLHANAVEVDGKAVAFMGESGAGKSTLAAWFHDRGHRIVADDVCVVGFSKGGQAFAHPGLPRLRLWDEALEASGRSAADFQNPTSTVIYGRSSMLPSAVPRPSTAICRSAPPICSNEVKASKSASSTA